MSVVYILYSKILKRYYTGSCLNLEQRFDDHKNKKYQNSYTSGVNDWEVFYYIENLQYNQARKIELHIKKMKSKKYIENLKKYEDISLKLRDMYK